MPVLKVLTGSVSLTVSLGDLRAFPEPVVEPVVLQVLLSFAVLDLATLSKSEGPVGVLRPCLGDLEIEEVPLTMWLQRN